MNCLRISALALVAVALSACGSKGSDGDAGPAGPAGPQGGVYAAPQIQAVSPPLVTRSQQIAIYGTGFNADPALNRVYVGSHQATIVGGDATTLIVTASVAVDVIDDVTSLLVTVVSNNQTSNPYEVLQIPPGLEFNLGQAHTGSFFSGFSLDTNGDQLVSDAGLFIGNSFDRINRVSVAGNVTTEALFEIEGASIGGTAWKRADGLYYLTPNLGTGQSTLYRMTSTGEQQTVLNTSVIRASDGVWDAAGNLYMFQNNIGRFFFFGPSNTVLKFDPVAKQVTTFRTAATGVQGIAVVGDFLYVATAAGQIEKIELANNANITPLIGAPVANTIQSLGTDGTDLLAWADSDGANGLELTKYDTAGAATIFSAIDLVLQFTGVPTNVAADANGRWFVGNPLLGLYRVPNDVTKDGWYQTSFFGGTVGEVGDRTFLGFPLFGQIDPDLAGGPLYELMADGSLRRVSGDLAPSNGALGASGGQIVQYDPNTTAFEKVNVDTGVTTVLFDVDDMTPEIGDPEVLATDAAGNVYASYFDSGLGEYSIAKISAAGVLSDDFILFPNFEEPQAMVVQGTRLVVSDSSVNQTLLEVPIAAGGTATYIDEAIALNAYSMTLGASGDVLLIDNSNAIHFLRPDNTIEHRYTDTLSGNYYREADLGYLYGFDESLNFTVVLP